MRRWHQGAASQSAAAAARRAAGAAHGGNARPPLPGRARRTARALTDEQEEWEEERAGQQAILREIQQRAASTGMHLPSSSSTSAAAAAAAAAASSSSSAYDPNVMDEISRGAGLQALYSVRHASTSLSPAPRAVQPKYKTVMLKVSGEALQGKQGFGIDPEVLQSVAEEVAQAWQAGVRIAIVVGGGNFFRGVSGWKGLKLERATADYTGMLATVMNALCLQSALEGLGVETRVQTAIEMREVAEPYIRRRAMSHLKAGRVVIFGAGTGNPFMTTDTAAALRAAEVNAEVFLKATKVDGIYDSDPVLNPQARRFDKLSYRQVTLDSLNVMDATAITLCKENAIPVIVFNIMDRGNILKAALGEPIGTVVCESPDSHTNPGTQR